MKTVFLPDGSIDFNTVVALGDFDGVHNAHKLLIEKAVKLAKDNNLKSLVYTFENNPKKGANITTNSEKEEILSEIGVDVLAFQKVDADFFDISPLDFVKNVVIDKLKAKFVVVGENYTFGKNKEGTSSYLKALLEKNDITCEVVDLVKIGDKTISSTRIREFLLKGEIENANKFLGRKFTVSGNVIYGKQIGSKMGFPTVNIKPEENAILPKFGVYVTYVKLKGKEFKGVSNVGIKPTVGGKTPLVETHIFDLEEFLYGEYVEIKFERFIRDEKKFLSIDELKKQIEEDKKRAKNIFKDGI